MKIPTLKEHTDRFIRRVFRLCDNRPAAAAKLLGIGRATAYREGHRLGILQPADPVALKLKRQAQAERARLEKYRLLYEQPLKTL